MAKHAVHRIEDEMSTAGNPVTTFTYYDQQANEVSKSTPDSDIIPTVQRIKDYWAQGVDAVAFITVDDTSGDITNVSYVIEKPE